MTTKIEKDRELFRGRDRYMKAYNRLLSWTLLLVLGILLLGCSGQGRSRPVIEAIGGTRLEIVDVSYMKERLLLTEWRAAGGFLLVAGGGTAGGGDRLVSSERLAAVVKLPKDGSLFVLELPVAETQFIVSDTAYVELKLWPSTDPLLDYGHVAAVWTPQRQIREIARSYVLHLPQEDIDTYITTALTFPSPYKP